MGQILTANCCFCLKIIDSKKHRSSGEYPLQSSHDHSELQACGLYREGDACKYTKSHSYIIYYYRVLLSERDTGKVFVNLPSLIIPTLFAYCLHTFWHAIHISFYILNVFLSLNIYIYIYIFFFLFCFVLFIISTLCQSTRSISNSWTRTTFSKVIQFIVVVYLSDCRCE